MEESSPIPEGEKDQPQAAEAVPISEAEGKGSPEMEMRSLRAELEQKNNELRAAQEKQLRVYAELENYKKRTARDQMEQVRYANEKLLKEILPVLDNLERAVVNMVAHMKDAPELSRWVEGVELTYRQCLDILKKFGVTPIASIGEPFDPGRHQAVTYLDTHDRPENHVAEELQKGYLYHERVLRPSMVAVARKPSGTAAPEISEKRDERPDQANG